MRPSAVVVTGLIALTVAGCASTAGPVGDPTTSPSEMTAEQVAQAIDCTPRGTQPPNRLPDGSDGLRCQRTGEHYTIVSFTNPTDLNSALASLDTFADAANETGRVVVGPNWILDSEDGVKVSDDTVRAATAIGGKPRAVGGKEQEYP